MLHTDAPYYTHLHEMLKELLPDIGESFPQHSIFFATHDDITNTIRRVHDQAGLAIAEEYTDPFSQSFCRLAVASPSHIVAIDELASHAQTESHPFTQKHGNGSFLGTTITLQDGSSIGTLCLVSNQPYTFTDREQKWMSSMARMLSHLVHMEQAQVRDGVTNQYHARVLPQLFQEMTRTYPSVVFYVISIQDFQWINQQHGYPQGNELLQTFTEVLREDFPPQAVTSRINADTFAVLLPCTAAEHPESRAHALAGSFMQHIHTTPFRLNGRDQYIQISTGASYWPKDDTLYGECLETALKRSKRAKQEPDGLSIIDSDDALLLSEREFILRNELKQDDLYQQLSVHYQPQIHLTDHHIKGVEALIRWEHPAYGPVAPDVWIPIAETHGQIHAIGRWVLRQSCIELLTYGENSPPIDLSVNVSPLQLRQENFAGEVLEILRDVSFPAGRLILEITETMLLEEHEHVTRNLQVLRQSGIRIAIDDFGVGYASFYLLHRFPIDILKIDKQLSRPLTSPANKKIVSAILELAYSLQMHCIVEGIETSEQHSFYQQYAEYWGQGYHYHRPVPVGELPVSLEGQPFKKGSINLPNGT